MSPCWNGIANVFPFGTPSIPIAAVAAAVIVTEAVDVDVDSAHCTHAVHLSWPYSMMLGESK